MERSTALDHCHTSQGYGAHFHEFPGLYRNTDEGIWRGHSHQLINAAFAGITSIVNGKANALRAYRIIIAVLLQNFFSNGAKTYEELRVYLDTAREHPTGRLWVDCFVKHTLLSHLFLPGDRNGDFLPQQQCLKAVLPYFFAAGHYSYARYLSWYVRQMEHLPPRAKEDLLAGAHVCRHSDGGTASCSPSTPGCS